MERNTLEGDSPVDELKRIGFRKSNVSQIRGMNMAELTANPKYELKSDSVLVLRGKAEKYSCKRVKRLEI